MEKALPVIPAKRYFTIGEVSELCGVKPYVLRYWEQEFTQLKPMKRRGNRRYYQHHEVLLIRRIRELLYDHGFTISGARNRLADGALAWRGAPAGPDQMAGSPAVRISGPGQAAAAAEAVDDTDDDTDDADLRLSAAGAGAAGTPDDSAPARTGRPSGQVVPVGQPVLDQPAAGPAVRPGTSPESLRAELLSIRDLLTV